MRMQENKLRNIEIRAIFPYPRELFPIFNRLHTHTETILSSSINKYKYIKYHVQRISTTIRFKKSLQEKEQKVYIVKV